VAEAAIGWTLAFVRERRAFGQRIADFQNTQFVLAGLQARLLAGRALVDRCIELFLQGKLDDVVAAAAKMHLTDLHCEVVDQCLQLHGGAGYMWEYPIARAYADARVARITGGTAEVMKQIIARRMLADDSKEDDARDDRLPQPKNWPFDDSTQTYTKNDPFCMRWGLVSAATRPIATTCTTS
jgi:alkylation response protein AidB-like acyl-CoA dehydrogenase